MATGCEKLPTPANTCSSASDTPLPGASPARQEVFEGLASRPDTTEVGSDSVVAERVAELADSFGGIAPSNARTA